MGREDNLIVNIEKLISYWKNQSITSEKLSPDKIEEFEKWRHIQLPQDFKEYYKRANGMKLYYPNDTDAEGFLFYSLENVISAEDEFEGKGDELSFNPIYIFAEYMHKSWWYGLKLNDMKDTYEIGIIPYVNRFKVITNSLSEFIDLYLQDSSMLYDYE